MKVYVVLGYETCGATTRYEYLQQVRVASHAGRAMAIKQEMEEGAVVEFAEIEELEVEE